MELWHIAAIDSRRRFIMNKENTKQRLHSFKRPGSGRMPGSALCVGAEAGRDHTRSDLRPASRNPVPY